MTAFQSNAWLDGLEVLDREARNVSPSQHDGVKDNEPPFFVDVGGGHGHQSIHLLERHPQLATRIVLQDLPETISHLPATFPSTIHASSQNFFEPQPAEMRGAKFFYLRRILHDWPDKDCLKILAHLRDAVSEGREDNRILIDEVVLPDVNAPWQAVMQDMSMAIVFGWEGEDERRMGEVVG